MVTLEEVGPASLPVHDGARLPCGRTQALARQLNLAILAFGHVDGAEQRLDDGPAAWSVPQTWVRFQGDRPVKMETIDVIEKPVNYYRCMLIFGNNVDPPVDFLCCYCSA